MYIHDESNLRHSYDGRIHVLYSTVCALLWSPWVSGCSAHGLLLGDNYDLWRIFRALYDYSLAMHERRGRRQRCVSVSGCCEPKCWKRSFMYVELMESPQLSEAKSGEARPPRIPNDRHR